jgi:hypothetical protein
LTPTATGGSVIGRDRVLGIREGTMIASGIGTQGIGTMT